MDNAVHANLLAARSETRIEGEIFNVATGRKCTIKELAEKMAALAGRADLKPVYAPPRPGDVMHSLADLSRIAAALGYRPLVNFEEGLKATIDWYGASAGGR